MSRSVKPAPRSARVAGAEQATRDRLVTEALRLFLQNGYRETSVQEIVAAADVTKGAFYHYFTSKDDIILLAHQEYMERVLSTLHRIEAEESSAAEKLEAVISAMVEGVATHRAQLALFIEQRRMLRGPRFKAVKKLRDEFEVMFTRLIEEGMAAGEYRTDLAPRHVGLGILGMLTWLYQWMRDDGPDRSEDVARVFSGMVLNGITKA